SGVRVTPDSAMRLSAVYACTRILAETMASLPLRLYKHRADGGKDLVEDHNLHRLLSKRPNQMQNAFEWREMMMGHLVLRGNAYNRIISNYRGDVTDIIPIHPDRIKLELSQPDGYRYRVTMADGSVEIVPRGEIWHLRGLSSDGYLGLSPISLAAESIGSALASQNYGARFFKNDAKPTGGWIEFPGKFNTDEARENYRNQMQRHFSGENRGKIVTLDQGMKYHEVGVSNRDSQFLELRQFQVVDIARLFRVPPHMIADLSKSSFSNIEQQSLDFVIHTIVPWAERFEASIDSTFIYQDEGIFVEFDFTNLLRGDASSRSAYGQSMVFSGIMSVNEARKREGLNPIPGKEFEIPRQPMNMGNAGIGKQEKSVASMSDSPDATAPHVPVESITEVEIIDADSTTTHDPPFTEERSALVSEEHSVPMVDHRLNLIAIGVAVRIARKEFMATTKAIDSGKTLEAAIEATYRTHAKYVSESLSVSQEDAGKYCEKMKGFLISGGPSSLPWLEDMAVKSLAEIGGFTL
ncbi:MAG: phage portal protein, partial [Magnetococcales bacterium]|nr:phage portal protein [Magnetococcales bacterium]